MASLGPRFASLSCVLLIGLGCVTDTYASRRAAPDSASPATEPVERWAGWQPLPPDTLRLFLERLAEATCRGAARCGTPGWFVENCHWNPAVWKPGSRVPWQLEDDASVHGNWDALEACVEWLEADCRSTGLGGSLLRETLGPGPDEPCRAVFSSSALPAEDGDPCETDLMCRQGFYCAGPLANECGPAICRRQFETGTSCTSDSQCGFAEGEFSACLGSSDDHRVAAPAPRVFGGDVARQCMPVTTGVVGNGEACGWEVGADSAVLRRCQPGLVCRGSCQPPPPLAPAIRDRGEPCDSSAACDVTFRYACEDGRCAEWGDGSLGSTCHSILRPCQVGLWCNFDGRCQVDLATGEECRWDDPPTHPAYPFGTRCVSGCCNASSNLCVTPPPLRPGRPRVPN